MGYIVGDDTISLNTENLKGDTMDYEKKHKEDWETAQEWYKIAKEQNNKLAIEILENRFPELKESEDERTRKNIIKAFKIFEDKQAWVGHCLDDIDWDACIAWVEKQGEQKSDDKIQLGKKYKCIASPRYTAFMKGSIYEPKDRFLCSLMNFCSDCFEPIEDGEQKPNKVKPKFKVGDWVVNTITGNVEQIIEITSNEYICSGTLVVSFDNQHLLNRWTIQDAKDGDVLATDSWLYMFKYTNNKALIQFHCKCPINGKAYKWSFLSDDSYLDIYIDANIHPATKEQRDILFQKMKEAGYEWDAGKKELKKKPTEEYNITGIGSKHAQGKLGEMIKNLKSTDKVEPKFKIGDWIIRSAENFEHNKYLITEIRDCYVCEDLKDRRVTFTFNDVHKNFKLWDISDAKDGDVLATKAGGIFIYKELLYDKPFAYCGVDKFGIFKDCNCGKGLDWTPYLSNVTPATKEQRDALMKAMADAGYEWDAEKKELKKIEHEPAEIERGAKGNDREIPNSAWSEEDENIKESIITGLEMLKDGASDQSLIALYNKRIDWLKSLKERYTWKPSDEQMKALADALSLAKNCGEEIAFDLRTLHEQLKKLMEE